MGVGQGRSIGWFGWACGCSTGHWWHDRVVQAIREVMCLRERVKDEERG